MKPSIGFAKNRKIIADIIHALPGVGRGNAYVFGSVARGDDYEGSDLNILIELDKRTGDIGEYMEAEGRISDLIGAQVFIDVSCELDPQILECAMKEVISL